VAPTSGLIGEWKLDEMGGTIAEDTKNGYDATVQGSAGFVAGKLGRALNLNNGTTGTGGKYAEMPSNATLDNVQEGDYTLSAWFYPYTAPPDLNTDDRHWAIVAKAGLHMGLMYEPDRRFSIRHYLTGPMLKNPHSATTYALNTWHHVAGVVSKATGTVTLYVNGAQAGSATFAAGTAAREYGTTRFRIGKGSSNWAADGKVDQVRIYNRALSAAEISDLYNETVDGGTQVSNCIGAPAQDHTTYSEKRVFLESQGWWGENTNGTVPKYGDAEHIHVGFCFPLGDTISDTITTFVVRVMGHRLPAGSVIQSTGLHDPNDGPNHISLASIAWNHTVTAQESTDPVGVVLWRTVTVKTKNMPNGLRELRNLTQVARPAGVGGAEIHASSGWCWTIDIPDNGAPVASGTCTGTGADFTMARGWYDCFEYKIAEVRNWDPYTPIISGNDYTLKIGARDGAGPNNHNTITSWEVRLDPDFHAGVKGDSITGGTMPASGVSATIPGRLMTRGPHKVAVITSAKGSCSGAGIPSQNGEVSGVLAIPLKVN
jgi:hypothetical protein